MLNIVPRMHDNVVDINEGDVFGPYNCSVDCNPPCVVSWAFLNSNESVSIKTQGGICSHKQSTETSHWSSVQRNGEPIYLKRMGFDSISNASI